MQFIKSWNTDMGKTNYYVIHIGVLIFPVGWLVRSAENKNIER